MGIKNHRNRMNRILTIGDVQYKLNRIVDTTATDIHHIMGKCNKMKYNVNIDENKTEIKRIEHIALNNYFRDKQNPREQLRKVFDLVKPVLSPGVRKELYTILYQTDDDMFYIPELIKGKKQKKKKEKKSDDK